MFESWGAGLLQQTSGALDETGRAFNVVDERLACGSSVTSLHRSDETTVMSGCAARLQPFGRGLEVEIQNWPDF